MLSDSTGYGGSSTNSSFYSTCVVIPTPSSTSSGFFQRAPNLRSLKKYPPSQSYSNDSHYFDGGYVSQSQHYYNYTDSSSSSSSELTDDERPQRNSSNYNSEIELGRFHSVISNDSAGSYFHSISTEDDTITTHAPTNPTAVFEGVRFRSCPGRQIFQAKPVMISASSPLPPRPSCTPWKRDAITDNYKTTVDLEYDDAPRGNSTQCKRSMIVSIRSSASHEKSLMRDMSEWDEPYIRQIEIDPDIHHHDHAGMHCKIDPDIHVHDHVWMRRKSINGGHHLSTIEQEAKGSSDSWQINKPVQPLVHELVVPTTSLPPPKPPRSETAMVRLRKAATFRHERPVINHSTFARPNENNLRIIKRLSMNVSSPKSIHFDEEEDRAKSLRHSTISHPSSWTPKPILKRTSRYENRRPDPSDALFGPVEHIYERIDSDSTATSDEERSSLKNEPDLRPELPSRPFARPFVLFPPDMTFQPRSFHAYHRRYSILKMPSFTNSTS